MIKFLTFAALVVLRIMYHPAVPPAPAPFAMPSSSIQPPAQLVCFNATIRHHQVLLNWVVKENQTADQFEIEKSTDGTHFSMAALVFGSDSPETGNYQFFEKAGHKKVLYRIKIIDKNQHTEYSGVIEVDPSHPAPSENSKTTSHAYLC